MIDAEKVKTHTLYSRYARLQKLAEDDIKNYGKYLDDTKPTYLPKYIENIRTAIGNETDPVKKSKLEKKLVDQEKNYAEYKPKYEDAVAKLPSYINEQKQLKNNKDQFHAPKEKRDEYLYVLDEETCTHLCKETDPTACRCTLFGPKTIELTGNQTDALRIWNNNAHVKGISIIDNRSYNIAHRDAIQLIPPKKVDPDRKVKIPGKPSQAWLISDQMSGAILENVTVEGCTVSSPKGPLQGIFSSDGFFTNLKIIGNDIKTAGSHTIVFNGMLSGEISGNTLRQVGNKKPSIHLYPARFGGNQAEEGMAYILNFANESSEFPDLKKYPKLAYKDIVDHGNQVIGTKGTESIKVTSQRDDVSEDYRWMSFGMTNFRYHAFQKEFSNLTFGEYKTSPKYRDDYKKLKFWLNEKVQEFTTGKRVDKGLPPLKPGDEKLRLIGSFLKKAIDNALNSNALDGFSLSNFPETPVRTFTMKQVALKYGDLKPLVALNPMGKNSSEVLERRRRTTLKHLLTEAQLTNIKPNPNPVEQTATSELPPAVKPDPTDTWSTITDKTLKEALRVSPSLSVPRGQEIQLSFDKTSPYNDNGYTYRWSVPGSDIPSGTNNTYTIKTNDLIVDHRYRLYCDVTKDGKMQRVIAFFEATQEEIASVNESVSTPEVNPAVKPDGADTWSNSADADLENALRVSPSLSVPLGEDITFSLIPPYNDTTSYTYRWTAFGTSLPVGTENTFVLKTDGLDIKNDQRIFCDVTKDGKMQRVIAFYDVTEKVASASETSSAPEVAQAVQPDGADTWSNAADADLENALRVSPSLSVTLGTDITLSLDSQSPFNGAGYSYRWTVFGTNIPVGTDNTFTIQTAGLKVQENHRLFCDVTKDGKMQRVIAFFDVKEKLASSTDIVDESADAVKPDPLLTWSKSDDATLKAALRVSPSLNVKKGDDIYLSLAAPYNSTDYSHRWLVAGTALPQGVDATYTIKTGGLNVDHKYRLFCDVTKDGVMQRVIAFFELSDHTISAGELITYIKHQIIDQETDEVVSGLPYRISFDNEEEERKGVTDVDGFIYQEKVPDAAYHIVLDDFNIEFEVTE